MFSNYYVGRKFVFALTLAIGTTTFTSAEAQVTPITTSARAGAYAHIDPNPSGSTIADTYFGALGPFNLTAHDYDETAPTLSCEVTSTCTGGVDPSGAFGSAAFNIHWAAINTFSAVNASGAFSGEGKFQYSFLLSAPMTLRVTVTTASNVGNAPPNVIDAMAINHTLTVDNTNYTDVPLNGVTVVEYPLNAGFHNLLMEHYPNVGTSPWPTTSPIAETTVAFTLKTPGDMNCDGSLTAADIQPMVLALTNPVQYGASFNCLLNGDMNGDGLVNGRDVQLFADALVP